MRGGGAAAGGEPASALLDTSPIIVVSPMMHLLYIGTSIVLKLSPLFADAAFRILNMLFEYATVFLRIQRMISTRTGSSRLAAAASITSAV